MSEIAFHPSLKVKMNTDVHFSLGGISGHGKKEDGGLIR